MIVRISPGKGSDKYKYNSHADITIYANLVFSNINNLP